MFRILVADDEKVTRKGIVTILKRGIKEEIEVLEAANGNEALDLVSNQMVHLIVTDICMPLCTGLEFVSKLRDNDEEMKVIIVSGYENFDYAKQALKLGVEDYITKPIQKEEFLGLVEKCLVSVKNKQQQAKYTYMEKRASEKVLVEVKNDALRNILLGEKMESSLNRLDTLRLSLESNFYGIGVVEYERSEELEELEDFIVKNIVDEELEKRNLAAFISITMDHGKLALIFLLHSIKEKAELESQLRRCAELVEKYARIKTVVGLGSVVYSVQELSKAFRESQLAGDFKIYNRGEKIIDFENLKNGKIPDKQPLDFRKIEKENEKFIQDYFHNLLQEKASIQSLQYIRGEYFNLCKSISKKTGYACKDFSELWSEFNLRKEIKDMIQYTSNIEVVTKESENSQIVEDIIDFTLQHVTEDIDLNFIADQFGRTPGYIGTLFRKSKEQGFNEFVTEERVQLAKNMLKDHRLSVQEVGERCGYHNPKYFSVVFKKVTGISPKTFQKQQGISGEDV